MRSDSYANAATNFAEIGSTADVNVHDLVVSGTHLDGFDTHEDAINWQFVNDTSASDTVDPSDTAGAPTGIGIRGYNSSVIGMRSDGNVICIQDSSQRFPFSGIFYKPSITRWVDPICNNNDIQGGTGANTYGFVLNGDSSDPSYGSHDPYATSLVQGGHFSNLSAAFDINEGANRLNINGVYMENVSRALLEVGPTDFSLTNSIFDDTNTFRVPAVGELTRRSLGSHYTGANVAIFGNDLWERTTLPAGSSTLPSTFFRTLETANTNGTTIYMGDQQLINGDFHHSLRLQALLLRSWTRTTTRRPETRFQKVTAVGVSLAATGDAAIIPIPSQITKYRVLGIDVGHCSASLTSALAGVWSAAGKGGTNIAASQALSGCTGGATNFSLALATGAGNTDLTSAKLYFNVGTSQASPTVDVTIWILDKSIN